MGIKRGVPLLLPHLAKGVSQIEGADLLGILELQKLIAAMPRHINQDITPLIRHQPLTARRVLAPAIRHEPDEILHGDLVPPIVDLDVVSVQVKRAIGVVEDGAGEGVARVAGHVVGQHEDDLRVRDPEALDGAVQREHVGQVAVVEPEARCPHQHRPVGRVLCGDQGRRRQEGEEYAGGLHGGLMARRKMGKGKS
jgi:hypothetical protein